MFLFQVVSGPPASTVQSDLFVISSGLEIFIIFIVIEATRGSVVVKALCYKLEGHGFETL
jgi:hypothetical protein